MALFTRFRHGLGILLRKSKIPAVRPQVPERTATSPADSTVRLADFRGEAAAMHIRLVTEPHAAEALKNIVREGLSVYNVVATGAEAYYPVCFLLKNEHDEILGGLLGHIWAHCMHIAVLWLAPILRHQGYGTTLMHAAEDLARQRACRLVYLETFSFQAPLFYARLGYETCAVLQDCPPGHQKHFLKKSL